MIPSFRYATTLRSAITNSGTTIVVDRLDNLNGKSTGGVDAAPLATGDFIRLLQPHPTNTQQYIAEVMEVVTITPNPDGSATIAVNRDDGTFALTPPDSTASGVYGMDSGAVALDPTPTVNYAFSGGVTVENLRADAKLRLVSAGATADDVFLAADRGSVSFINVGETTAGGYQVNSGMTISAFFDYRTASAKQINLGERLPNLEFIAELEHQYQDGRWFKAVFHKVAITPDEVNFEFQPTDWVGVELQMDCLRSTNPAHAANPTGFIRIDNDPITLQPVQDTTDDYTAGVFNLYLTPSNPTRALQYGIPSQRFSIGNVTTGGLNSPQEWLEHLVGIPQDLDKKIQIRRQFNVTATIDEINARNCALLFGGRISDMEPGWVPLNTLITVSNPPAAPYTVANVEHPLGAMMVNIGA